MEAIIHAKQLKEQVGALQGIFTRKETIPVLGKIKIEANQNGEFVMTATDLDVSLKIEQEVDVLQTGSICLSGKKLGEITAGLPNEPVHLKLDLQGAGVVVRAGRFKTKLSGSNSDEFPELIRVQSKAVKLSASVIYEGLRRTIFAAPDDSKRPAMSGVLLLLDQTGLKIVSTDGHRLCLFQMAVSQVSQSLICLIPIKAVRELKTLLANEIKANSKIDLKIKKGSQLEFEIGNKLMTAREISGSFPHWEKVVPKTFEFFAETRANELKDALMRVGVMADDSHRRIEFVFYRNKLVLKSESAETGSSTEEINCSFQGLADSVGNEAESGWKIAFNTKYLMDFLALQSVKQPESRVIWKFGSNSSQSLLTFEGEERMFSYVLVPLKC